MDESAALPAELHPHMWMEEAGIEPAANGFFRARADWADRIIP